MHVVRLIASDAPKYRDFMLHAYAVAADAFTSTPGERAAEPDSWWVKRVADPAGMSVGLGVLRDGSLIAAAAIEFSPGLKTRHKAQLVGMFVGMSFRRLGAGKALVQAALGIAQARSGVRVVTVTVTEGNEPALGLYRRCGFAAFGTEPKAILTPGGFKSKIHMSLELPVPYPPAREDGAKAAPDVASDSRSGDLR